MKKLIAAIAIALSLGSALRAQSTTPRYLPTTGGVLNGPLSARQIEGALYADQQQTGAGNNGIAMSLTQCLSLPYACAIVAPATYALTEQYTWEFLNYGGGGLAPQYGLPQSRLFLDQRFGANYEAVLNPETFYPGTGNVYVGGARKIFYGALGVGTALNQNYEGQLFSCVHTQGGSLSQLYDNVNQGLLNCLNVASDRSTAEAGYAVNVHYQASSPGDAVLYGGYVLGPAGNTHPNDEGIELASQYASETINVYRGTIATAPSSTSVTITPATAGAGSGEVIAGTQGDHRYLLDTSTSSSFTPSAVTSYAGQVISGAAYSYFSSVTGTGFTVSSATGYLTSAVTAPYGSETVTFTANSGALAAGIACIADQRNEGANGQQAQGNFEMISIPATPSGGSFTAVFHKSHPVGATYWQGGACGQFIELVADTLPSGSAWTNGENTGTTTYPVRYPYPVLGALNATTLVIFTGMENTKLNSVSFGSAWQSSSTKTANLYSGAEVYSVAGANDDLTDNVFTLAPNSAGFAVGQSVEESHMYSQYVHTGPFTMSQWSPSGLVNGPSYYYVGRMEYPAQGVGSYNKAPWTSYTNGGGAWTLPVAGFVSEGSFGYGFFHINPPGSGFLDVLGTTLPSASTTIGIFGMGVAGGQSGDQLNYTAPASGNSGGTFGVVGNLNVQGALQINGSPLSTLPVIYTPSLTPSAVSASSCAEQAFTVTGVAVGQPILAANPPSSLAPHLWIGSKRVSAANTVAIEFCGDATAGTPPSGTWIVVAN